MAKFTPSKEQAEAKRAESLSKLERGVAQLLESDNWQRYLQTQAKFHKYSFNNCIMIQMQRPESTQVAGFHKWKELGRSVRKGEKGITIFAPIRIREEEDERLLFKTATVFDVSQTDGEDLPEVAHELHGDAAHLLGQLWNYGVDHLKLELAYDHQLSYNGYCRYHNGKPVAIVINPNLSSLHQVKTLAHEIAHAILHTPQQYKQQYDHMGDVELEAESVAYVVMQHCGIDSGDYSFGYVAHWQNAAGEDLAGTLAQLKQSAANIHTASAQMIEWLEQPVLVAA